MGYLGWLCPWLGLAWGAPWGQPCPSSLRSGQIVKKSCYPRWNETFEFELEEGTAEALCVEAWDWAPVSTAFVQYDAFEILHLVQHCFFSMINQPCIPRINPYSFTINFHFMCF